MEGKIDKNGTLWIKRGVQTKKMSCPFANKVHGDYGGFNTEVSSCGDWCPLLDAPYTTALNSGFYLPICKRELEFTKFIDEGENVLD